MHWNKDIQNIISYQIERFGDMSLKKHTSSKNLHTNLIVLKNNNTIYWEFFQKQYDLDTCKLGQQYKKICLLCNGQQMRNKYGKL